MVPAFRLRFPAAGRSGIELGRLSLEALSRHRLRTFLSVTGIVIGIGAIIAMLSVGEGAREEAIRQVELLGLNNVVFRPRPIDSTDATPDREMPISFEDVDRLALLVPFALEWSPLIERWGTFGSPGATAAASVLGVAPGYQRIMRLKPVAGRLLTAFDLEQDRRVGVLGASLARTLFGAANAVGRALTIEGEAYTVVGVLEPRASPGLSGGTISPRDLNASALVPMRRTHLLGQPSMPSELWMQVPDGAMVTDGAAVAARALWKLHGGVRDFEVLVPRELLQQRLQVQRTFNVVLGSVAVLSLLVGGIGIMNMMLASVLERTSEIGLRRSVGATRRWITYQFLIESVLMTGTGGVFGVVLGAAAAVAVTRYAGWPTHVSAWAVAVSLAVSCGVGLFFGTYPARRAARLEPVEAVRYE